MANPYKSDHKKRMLQALENSLGVVTTACKKVGIARDTHYRWLKEDSEYRDKVKALEEVAIDFAESQLYNQIKQGDTTATIFFLKTKGRSRGYIERKEVDARLLNANEKGQLKNLENVFKDADKDFTDE